MITTNITVNTQSSIRIDGSKVLYFDPFQIASQSHDADLVFITHSHYDHFDPESVGKVSKADTVFIAPAGMEQEIRKAAGDAELILMEPGDTREIPGISIKAVWKRTKLSL
jgi:L-ascorbate metabolism protein UlaG (beta-lactamase superfamily)